MVTSATTFSASAYDLVCLVIREQGWGMCGREEQRLVLAPLLLPTGQPLLSSSGHCEGSHGHLPTVVRENPQGLPGGRRPYQLAALLLLRGHHQHHQVRGPAAVPAHPHPLHHTPDSETQSGSPLVQIKACGGSPCPPDKPYPGNKTPGSSVVLPALSPCPPLA